MKCNKFIKTFLCVECLEVRVMLVNKSILKTFTILRCCGVGVKFSRAIDTQMRIRAAL